METKIADLKSRIGQLETEEENGRSRERSLANYASEQGSRMNNAAIEMAYHKKYL
jgi:hypothetical protein